MAKVWDQASPESTSLYRGMGEEPLVRGSGASKDP